MTKNKYFYIYAMCACLAFMPGAAVAVPNADDVISDLFVYGSITGDSSGLVLGYVGDDVGATIGGAYSASYTSWKNGFTSANRAQHQNEWTVQWPLAKLESGSGLSSGATIRGIAQCNRVGGTFARPNYDMIDPYTTVTEDGEKNCWCKLTGVSAKSGADIAVAGDWMSPRGAAWVFFGPYSSAAACGSNCAYRCAGDVRNDSAFRAAVFGVGALGRPAAVQMCGKNLANGKLYDYQVPRTVQLQQNKYTASIATNDGKQWAIRIRRVSDGVALTALADIKAALASSDLELDDSAAEDIAARDGWVFGVADNGLNGADKPIITFDLKGDFLVDIAKIDATGTQNLMLEIGESASAYVAPTKCVGKIATTARSEAAFERTKFVQNVAMRTIAHVVEKTINQANSIGELSGAKQTRPADDYSDSENTENCPAGHQCLLVEDENGDPHWYKIFDPVQWFMGELWKNNETCRYTQSGENWTYYNAFYMGDKKLRKMTNNTTDVYERPFAGGTRCTNPSYANDTRRASPCYETMTGAFHTLQEKEWALVFEGGEGTDGTITNPKSAVRPGIVYGESKCTAVAGPNNYATANPTRLYQLSAANQAAWAVEPTESTKANYKQCWCKMTGVGVNDAASTVADLTNGKYYPVSGAAWVFFYTFSSAALCANDCARNCAGNVRGRSAFRAAVFGVGAN